jgi:xylose isomerase
MNEEPLVNMEVVSNETDPLLFRYSKTAATNQSQDVFPVTWCEVQVRTAVEVTAYVSDKMLLFRGHFNHLMY